MDSKPPLNPILLSRARAMRSDPSPAERRLWPRLRNRALGGFKFRRQAPVGAFIADFLCAECRLIVELDGDSHAARCAMDVTRTNLLEREGYRVIRFHNAEVFTQMDAVLGAILEACLSGCGVAIGSDATPHAPSPRPLPEGEGEDRAPSPRPLPEGEGEDEGEMQ